MLLGPSTCELDPLAQLYKLIWEMQQVEDIGLLSLMVLITLVAAMFMYWMMVSPKGPLPMVCSMQQTASETLKIFMSHGSLTFLPWSVCAIAFDRSWANDPYNSHMFFAPLRRGLASVDGPFTRAFHFECCRGMDHNVFPIFLMPHVHRLKVYLINFNKSQLQIRRTAPKNG